VVAPVLIVDGVTGAITGIRAPADSDGAAKLRRHVERCGLSTRAAAKALQGNDSTLRADAARAPRLSRRMIPSSIGRGACDRPAKRRLICRRGRASRGARRQRVNAMFASS